jgi:hypothetical protein
LVAAGVNSSSHVLVKSNHKCEDNLVDLFPEIKAVMKTSKCVIPLTKSQCDDAANENKAQGLGNIVDNSLLEDPGYYHMPKGCYQFQGGSFFFSLTDAAQGDCSDENVCYCGMVELDACSNKCFDTQNCKYFLFGEGKCYHLQFMTHDNCSTGWISNEKYNVYKIHKPTVSPDSTLVETWSNNVKAWSDSIETNTNVGKLTDSNLKFFVQQTKASSMQTTTLTPDEDAQVVVISDVSLSLIGGHPCNDDWKIVNNGFMQYEDDGTSTKTMMFCQIVNVKATKSLSIPADTNAAKKFILDRKSVV